jgi:hypothetical protein
MNKLEVKNWAAAISTRISDEWAGSQDFPQDVELLKNVLLKCFQSNSEEMVKLIGTGIIEKDFFKAHN